jgi:hypothetical protein
MSVGKMNINIKLKGYINREVDEISDEDLEVTVEKFDDIKVNPEKYFHSKEVKE